MMVLAGVGCGGLRTARFRPTYQQIKPSTAAITPSTRLHTRQLSLRRRAQPLDRILERCNRNFEAVLHTCVVGIELAREAAVLELHPVRVLEVDRLGPVVIYYVADL